MNENILPLKKRKLGKKSQKMEDEIKINLQLANQNWNDCTFQIHWNKLEWVNPRSRIKLKNPFCVSSKKICLKIIIKLHIGLVTRN